MIIDKPGFYTSKAGKCDARYSDDIFGFGYTPHGYTAVWLKTGECIWAGGTRVPSMDDLRITGKWTEPRKQWVAVEFRDGNLSPSMTEEHAKQCVETGHGARLVHLREVEE